MNKKRELRSIILATLLFIFTFAFPFSSLAQAPPIDAPLQSQSIISTVETLPAITSVVADYYYEDASCKEAFITALRLFQGHLSEGTVKKISLASAQKKMRSATGTQDAISSLPLLILDSTPPVIIAGAPVCSTDALVRLLCRYVPNATSCSNTLISTIKNPFSPEILHDNPCRESCTVERASPFSDAIITETIRSSVCNPLPTYDETSSAILSRECLDQKSCASDEPDKACCSADECVLNGACYPIGSAIDVGNDDQTEVCAEIETSSHPKWANPDISKDVCSAVFHWVSPESLGLKKPYGTTEYNKKELCCGDDKGEQYTPCSASFCTQDDAACCPQGWCSFMGKCYDNGCQSFQSSEGKISAYCNGGVWEDLDQNHCADCLSKSRSSEFVCCGDDADEGAHPTPFSVRISQSTYSLEYTACTKNKNNCVFPDSGKEFAQGCYTFNQNSYINGGHYCNNAQWYDLDASKKYCKKCGFTFTTECCGDDQKEFLVTGSDGSLGCCKRPSDEVLNGVCLSTLNCGNGKLDKLEQCDPPSTDNNGFCSQATIKCQDNKRGYRDQKGYCDDSCLCMEDNYTYSCTKGSCGATCSTEKDCLAGYQCDQNSCGCVKRSFCGDGIISEKNDDGWKEECEPPKTRLNPACNVTQKCFGLRTGLQYQYGSCTDDCLCSYPSYQRLCIKGSCGAECNQDGSGCATGQTCDSNSCECIDADASCGDNICGLNELYICPKDCVPEPCPSRIDVSLDKSFYRTNDTVNMHVKLYDAANQLLTNTPFEVDLLINQQYVETSRYYTPSDGNYERTFRIQSSLPSGNYQYVAYIAKSRNPACDTVGDTTHAFVYVDALGLSINASPYGLAYGIQSTSIPACGNAKIDPGEACEGDVLCRTSSGCNPRTRTFDIPEACIACSCPRDLVSAQNDGIYCANCQSCGDGSVNCNEDCESGVTERGLQCRGDQLYVRRDGCSNCTFTDDGVLNDDFVDDCMCSCPLDPKTQCAKGDYVDYPASYAGSCMGEACSPCNCGDQYTKDINQDGVEDKCSKEECTNGIDDDDDGKKDMADEDCSLCQYCGYGISNACDRSECGNLLQGCFFTSSFFAYGKCFGCSKNTACESYGLDATTCSANPCKALNCTWKPTGCCTDEDQDGLCAQDNCPSEKNQDQEDSDRDGKGDVCDLCPQEPALVFPAEKQETNCEDRIDNDCDGVADCQDTDCAGSAGCCQTASDCPDQKCKVENCLNNKCTSISRSSCDTVDCPKGEYCTSEGECSLPTTSPEICTSCIEDSTSGDEGVGYQDAFSYGGTCCGDSVGEYYVADSSGNDACCPQQGSCVFEGKCFFTNTLVANASLLCSAHETLSCSPALACSSPDAAHTCTFDNSWAWRKTLPRESCADETDNDCDGLADTVDSDCQVNAINISRNTITLPNG